MDLREGDEFSSSAYNSNNGQFSVSSDGRLVVASVTATKIRFASMKAPGSSVTISPGAQYIYNEYGILRGDPTDSVYTSLPANSLFKLDNPNKFIRYVYQNNTFFFRENDANGDSVPLAYFTMTARGPPPPYIAQPSIPVSELNSECGEFYMETPSSMPPGEYSYFKTNLAYGEIVLTPDSGVRSVTSLCFDSNENMYVVDMGSHKIFKFPPNSSTPSLVIGSGVRGNADGPATTAQFAEPMEITLDSSGNMYVTAWGNGSVRKITPDGTVSTVLYNIFLPAGIAIDPTNDNTLFVGSYGDHVIYRVDMSGSGSIITIGTLSSPGYKNGSVKENIQFKNPTSLTVDTLGNVYIVDGGNHVIRKFSQTDGTISLFAGTPGGRGSTDGFTSTFNYPSSINIDASNTLYVTDWGNGKLRKISSNGFVSTVQFLNKNFRPYSVGIKRSTAEIFFGDVSDQTVGWAKSLKSIIKVTQDVDYYLAIDTDGTLKLVSTKMSTLPFNPREYMDLRLEWKSVMTPNAGSFIPVQSANRTDYRRILKSRLFTGDSIVVYTGSSQGRIIQIQGASIPVVGTTTPLDLRNTILTFFPTQDMTIESYVYVTIPNIDKSGGDIQTISNDQVLARQTCSKTPTCKGIVEIPSTRNYILKTDVSTSPYPFSDRKMQIKVPYNGYAVLTNIDKSGSEIRNEPNNPESCTYICNNIPSCVGFTYNTGTKMCSFKSDFNSSIVSSTGINMYVKSITP